MVDAVELVVQLTRSQFLKTDDFGFHAQLKDCPTSSNNIAFTVQTTLKINKLVPNSFLNLFTLIHRNDTNQDHDSAYHSLLLCLPAYYDYQHAAMMKPQEAYREKM